MTARRSALAIVATTALAAGLTLALGGCAYDYLQRSDRIAYSAGNAVKANLESETINPARDSAYSTRGLGKNGAVVPTSPGAAAADE